MSVAASTKPVDGAIPMLNSASAIVEAIDTNERALLRCRAIAATMPMRRITTTRAESFGRNLSVIQTFVGSAVLRIGLAFRGPGLP